MHERRKHPRKSVAVPLKVTDLDRERPLGHLVDISLEGFMLITREDLPVNRVFQVGLDLPGEMAPEQIITFGAESLWRELSGASDQYWMGFQIIDIADAQAETLRRLIDDHL